MKSSNEQEHAAQLDLYKEYKRTQPTFDWYGSTTKVAAFALAVIALSLLLSATGLWMLSLKANIPIIFSGDEALPNLATLSMFAIFSFAFLATIFFLPTWAGLPEKSQIEIPKSKVFLSAFLFSFVVWAVDWLIASFRESTIGNWLGPTTLITCFAFYGFIHLVLFRELKPATRFIFGVYMFFGVAYVSLILDAIFSSLTLGTIFAQYSLLISSSFASLAIGFLTIGALKAKDSNLFVLTVILLATLLSVIFLPQFGLRISRLGFQSHQTLLVEKSVLELVQSSGFLKKEHTGDTYMHVDVVFRLGAEYVVAAPGSFSFSSKCEFLSTPNPRSSEQERVAGKPSDSAKDSVRCLIVPREAIKGRI